MLERITDNLEKMLFTSFQKWKLTSWTITYKKQKSQVSFIHSINFYSLYVYYETDIVPSALEADLRKTILAFKSSGRERERQGIQQLKQRVIWSKVKSLEIELCKYGQEVQKQFNKERPVFTTDGTRTTEYSFTQE